MFTGIIQAIGSIQEFRSSDNGANLKINSNTLDISDSKIGDSIAVNGVCLTVTEISGEWFSADVSNWKSGTCPVLTGWCPALNFPPAPRQNRRLRSAPVRKRFQYCCNSRHARSARNAGSPLAG